MSEWCQIDNGFLTVQVTSKGAEMKRFFHRAWNKELLWDGENKIWERSAPILFPIVGKLKEDQYIFQDKKYNLSQHGFARDMEFECTKAEIHECEFVLSANQATFAQYPFLFELKVGYVLQGHKLIINYSVKNCDRQNIYFSLGAHPGFETANINNFAVEFEKEEESYFLTKDGLLDTANPINFHAKELPLNAECFANGALVFKNIKSEYIDLIDKGPNHIIRLSGVNVPFLGIWGKEHVPFVCLEPWFGVADLINHDQQIEKKVGIIRLEEKEIFTFTYSIEAFQA
jgi:galactose mutarotase-like enzyme